MPTHHIPDSILLLRHIVVLRENALEEILNLLNREPCPRLTGPFKFTSERSKLVAHILSKLLRELLATQLKATFLLRGIGQRLNLRVIGLLQRS